MTANLKKYLLDNQEDIYQEAVFILTVDPPPDLAIEVDFTSIINVGAYELLKISNWWVYRRESLIIYLLEGKNYQESEESRLFPDINIKKISPYYVELAWIQGASVALRQFDALDNFS